MKIRKKSTRLVFSGGRKMNGIKNLIEALRRFDSLETVIAELEAFDSDENVEITVDDLTEYLNDEADYANY